MRANDKEDELIITSKKLNKKIAMDEQHIGRLKLDLADKEVELERQGRFMSELQAQHDKKKAIIEIQQKEVDRLRNKVNELNAELEGKLEMVKSENSKTLDTIRQRDQEFKKRQEELDRALAQLALNLESLEADKKLVDLKGKNVDSKSAELDGIIKKYDKYWEDLNQKREKIAIDRETLEQDMAEFDSHKSGMSLEHKELSIKMEEYDSLIAAYNSKLKDADKERVELKQKEEEVNWTKDKLLHERRQFEELQAERSNDFNWKVEKFDHERNEFDSYKNNKMKDIHAKIAENEGIITALEKERKIIREGNQDARAEKELNESLLKKNITQLEDIKKARNDIEQLRKDKGGMASLSQELDAKYKDITLREKEMAKKEQEYDQKL